MTASSPILRVEGITVRRSGRLLLDDVSLTVHRGEIVGVIGPNGAGKTTLFESIAGLLPTDGGVASLPSSDDTPETAMFYLPDAIRPWSEQRLLWCLDHFARLFGRERDESAITALQLDHLLRQRVGWLSKGEAKRFGLALALATPQPLLLLDEPFEGLDFKQTRSAMQLLRSAVESGRTLILSIHQLVDAARICDRFLLLDHGRAIAAGSLTDLQKLVANDHASLEEVFLALE